MGADNANIRLDNTFVNVTSDREACQKHWVAVLVHTNCEKKTVDKFNTQCIENYLPTRKEVHKWSDRNKIIYRVIIPAVVFLHISKNDYAEVLGMPYVRKFITNPGAKETATVIPDDQIERLKFLLDNTCSDVTIVSSLRLGEHVRIIRGVLNGLEGELCQIGGNQTVAIRIEGLGYACVTVAKGDVMAC